MYVRGADNVLKRVLVQAAAFNIGLLLRTLSGWGKPRQPQGRRIALSALLLVVSVLQDAYRVAQNCLNTSARNRFRQITTAPVRWTFLNRGVSATGC
jgi:hypothetical protein